MKSARVGESLVGKIIKNAVFSEQGNKLLGEGVFVDEKVLKKLVNHNIDYVYVIEALTEDVSQLSIVEEKKILDSILVVKDVFVDVMESERMGIRATIPQEHIKLVEDIIEELMKELENAKDILYTVVDLINADMYTYRHSVHVAILSIITAKALNYTRVDIKNIALGALLHDIGKMRVDMSLILKPGKLTPDENKEVQKHAEYGYELLEAVLGLPYTTRQIIRLHHEKLDGSGYPLGLHGIEIPEYVRIVTVCDMYDAMTTDRVYRSKMPIYRAIDILMKEAVSKIDSSVYGVMMRNIAVYPIGTGVILSDGSIGVVTSYKNLKPTRPCIRILTNKIIDGKISMKNINLEENTVLFIEKTWDVELKRKKSNDKNLPDQVNIKTEEFAM